MSAVKSRWIVGLEQFVQQLRRLVLVVLLDRLGDQSEEFGLVALTDATGTAIGQIGLDRLLPGGLRGFGVAGGAFEVFQVSTRSSRAQRRGHKGFLHSIAR